MPDQFWLTKAQLKRIQPHFPQSRGVPRVDDRRVVSGIIHVIRNGLRWRDAPADYGSKLKDWLRIALRYDRCAHTFFSAICIAAAVNFWLGK